MALRCLSANPAITFRRTTDLMERSARVVFPGRPHHVVQRGYRKRDLFYDDEDRLDFIIRLAEETRAAGVHIWAYSLMRNHVHLIAVPEETDSFSIAIGRCLAGYTRAFHIRHQSGGDLWHEPFYASPLVPQYLWDAVRYVERNPVRAGGVSRAEDYRWSSARYHCGLRDLDPLVSPSSPLKGALADWSAWLREPDLDGRLANLRRKGRNRPAGPREFVGVFDLILDQRISREIGEPDWHKHERRGGRKMGDAEIRSDENEE